jgi:hypothetical protein
MTKTHNPESVVGDCFRELSLILGKLDEIKIPELERPPVPHGEPATVDLLVWAANVYFYSALCQFRELLRSTLLLVDQGHVSAVFFCCRGLFELAAHAYYVRKHFLQYWGAKNFDIAWQFLFEINLGSRDMRRLETEAGVIPQFPESPHIARVMACFNEYFPDGHKEKQATTTYSSLSEFSHPNCFAFINHFEWETDVRDISKVTFGLPSRNLLTLCLPAACIAAMAFLQSMGKLLGGAGQRDTFQTIEGIIKELLDRSKTL